MTESLYRHQAPDLRAADIQSLASLDLRHGPGINFADIDRGYFLARDGRRYCYHFPGYSLLALPARAVLGLLPAHALRAMPVTNALLLLLALACVLLSSALDRPRRCALFLLALFSPVAGFVLWNHPESACFALVLLALLSSAEGRHGRAVLLTALAAMQNPPLVVLGLVLGFEAVRAAPPAERWRRGGWSALLVLPAFLPAAFFLWKFGTPSLVGREAASLDALSLKRTAELFFDLNLGLLPYVPLTLGLYAASLVGRRGELLRGAALLLMAFACTATLNWNSGTTGPIRYAIWLLPIILWGVANAPGLPRAALAAAVALQAAITLGRGGLHAPLDYLEHSYAARLALRYAPAWYNPTPDIFWKRTLHAEYAPEGPVIYENDGVCAKAWARPGEAEAIRRRCGRVPSEAEAFLAREGYEWRYVDF